MGGVDASRTTQTRDRYSEPCRHRSLCTACEVRAVPLSILRTSLAVDVALSHQSLLAAPCMAVALPVRGGALAHRVPGCRWMAFSPRCGGGCAWRFLARRTAMATGRLGGQQRDGEGRVWEIELQWAGCRRGYRECARDPHALYPQRTAQRTAAGCTYSIPELYLQATAAYAGAAHGLRVLARIRRVASGCYIGLRRTAVIVH